MHPCSLPTHRPPRPQWKRKCVAPPLALAALVFQAAPAAAMNCADVIGLSLPSTAVAQQLFSSCTAHGGKGWDHSAMVRALELMAGHEIAAS